MSETQNDCQPSTSGSGGSDGPSKNVEKNVTAVEECNKSEEGEETGAVTMLDVLQVRLACGTLERTPGQNNSIHILTFVQTARVFWSLHIRQTQDLPNSRNFHFNHVFHRISLMQFKCLPELVQI